MSNRSNCNGRIIVIGVVSNISLGIFFGGVGNKSKGRSYSALGRFKGLRRNVIATTTKGIACLGATTIMSSQY